jgi:hypothetical protein
MNPSSPPTNKSSDMRWLRWGLAAIAFLLTLIAVELSVLIGPTQPRAVGQGIPDSGSQLNQLIDGNKQLNRTTQQIHDHLRTGEIKVNVGGADKESRGGPAPAPHTTKPASKSRPAASRAR